MAPQRLFPKLVACGDDFFLFHFWLHSPGMQDLDSPTRDRTQAPCIGNVES